MKEEQRALESAAVAFEGPSMPEWLQKSFVVGVLRDMAKMTAASPSAGQWIAFDIGCIECGEESSVIGVYSTEKEAEAACEKAAELQKANWTGEHHMKVFQLPAPPLSDIKGEK